MADKRSPPGRRRLVDSTDEEHNRGIRVGRSTFSVSPRGDDGYDTGIGEDSPSLGDGKGTVGKYGYLVMKQE